VSAQGISPADVFALAEAKVRAAWPVIADALVHLMLDELSRLMAKLRPATTPADVG
jgi:hypothetical protein